jgi:hypothetical protein
MSKLLQSQSLLQCQHLLRHLLLAQLPLLPHHHFAEQQ